MEHAVHRRDAAHIPGTDALVEAACKIKHAVHIRYAAGVPCADVLVESDGDGEDFAHGSD
eukprot:scaffold270_cov309-Pinguiococcus_pyrenoidosus.AAC.4